MELWADFGDITSIMENQAVDLRERRLRYQGISLLTALVVQYALGMYVNLFVQFPDNAGPVDLWRFAVRQWPLAFHIILGALLFIGSLALMMGAIRYRSYAWQAPAVIGFIAILIAAISGTSFIPTRSDPFSYVMALSFILAILAYSWGMMRAGRILKPPATAWKNGPEP